MLYLIRHGQTDWNKAHKLQGSTDIPLNETGRKMARDARESVDRLQLDICYTSPLQRARETAELIIGHRGIPVIEDERLKEIYFGKYEGDDRYRYDPTSNIYRMFHDPVNYIQEDDAESFDDLYERVRAFLNDIKTPLIEEQKNILIVAHGATNLAIANLIENVPIESFWDGLLKNCEVAEMDMEKVIKFLA